MKEKRQESSLRLWAGRVILCLSAFLLLFIGLTLPHEEAAVHSYQATGRDAAYPWPKQPDGSIDVNAADLSELCQLPSIGETLGQAILDARAAGGSFFYPEDLRSVRGIGEKKLAGMMPLICLSDGAGVQ